MVDGETGNYIAGEGADDGGGNRVVVVVFDQV